MSARSWGRRAALALLVFVALPAQAWAASGQISGTVTDASTHDALPAIAVTAYDSNEDYVASGQTDASGGYTISGLSPGVYEVGFDDGAGTHASQFYNDEPSLSAANGVTVASGQATTGVDAALADAGAISGTVTGAPDSTPVAGVTVEALDSYGNVLGSTTTDSSGAYTIGGLRAGSYTVGFFPGEGMNYVARYYDGETTQAAADSIAVSDGNVTRGIDAQLLVGGEISGRVTSATGGSSLDGIEVSASGVTGYWWGTATTDANGDYTIVGLPDDSYVVSFYSPDGAYVTEQYNNEPPFGSGDPVAVTTGSGSTGIDAMLQSAAKISGVVSDGSMDTKLEGIEAIAYDANGSQAAWADTNRNGTYTLSGLAAGTYRVEFSNNWNAGNYLTQYYNDKATLASADAITAQAGQTTAGINASMRPGGEITGTVTDAQTHAPIAFSPVNVYDSSGNFLTSTDTGSDGTYTVPSLPTGSYRVQFTGPGLTVSQFYDGKTSLASADPVAVTASNTTSGIDGALQDGGSITGTVTESSTGAPLSGVSVYATGPTWGGYAITDAQGHYAVSGLATGNYQVQFSASGYLTQFYDHRAGASSADPVSVTVSQTTRSIDASLTRGAIIAGTLTDANTGQPISGEIVFADDTNGQEIASTSTDSSGQYQLSGLTTGSYEVGFGVYGTGPNYVPAYYDGAQCSAAAGTATSAGQSQYSGFGFTCTPTSAGAAHVAATEGQTTSGIDGAMQRGAVMSGTVTDAATDASLQNIGVTVYDSAGDYLGQTYTAPEGTYFLDSLPAGNYKVGFSNGGSDGGYLPQYYNDRASLGTADTVTLASAASKTGVDAALQSGGQVSGTVVDSSTHRPLSNVSVTAYDSSGSFAAFANTDSTGKYALTGLATGSYRIEFQAFSGGYVTQYYNGKQTLASADPVSVTVGHTTSGIDAFLSTGGSITGTVTDANQGSALSGISLTAYSFSGSSTTYAGSAITDSTGHYAITGLLTGSYKVQFSGGSYVTQFYNSQESVQDADPVGVTYGEATGNINAAVQEAGSIAGTVTDASSQTALASAFATAYNSQGIPVASALTGSNGKYQISGLPAGSYRVGFNQGSNRNYLPQYYNGQTSLGSANEITVSTGQTTSGIDAALEPGGQIDGTVTDASTDAPVSGIWVYAITPTGQLIATTQTNRKAAMRSAASQAAATRWVLRPRRRPRTTGRSTTTARAPSPQPTPCRIAGRETTTGLTRRSSPAEKCTGQVSGTATGRPLANRREREHHRTASLPVYADAHLLMLTKSRGRRPDSTPRPPADVASASSPGDVSHADSAPARPARPRRRSCSPAPPGRIDRDRHRRRKPDAPIPRVVTHVADVVHLQAQCARRRECKPIARATIVAGLVV